MEGVVSTALYFASSLTPVGQGAAISGPITTDTVIVAASASQQRFEADAPVVLRSANLVASGGGKSLSEVIGDELRRYAVDRHAPNSGGMFPGDQGRPRDGEDLDHDVAAEHDARIAFITQRIEQLRREGASTAPQINMLRGRLHMAIAARCLAVAREAVRHFPADSASQADPGACRPVRMEALNVAREHRRSGRTPLRVATVAHLRSSGRVPVVAGKRPPGERTGGVVAIGNSPHWASRGSERDLAGFSGSTPHAGAAHGATRHDAISGALADASSRARRSLATARRLLATGAGDSQRTDLKLAGLLHWKGSDTWSLADYSRSAA